MSVLVRLLLFSTGGEWVQRARPEWWAAQLILVCRGQRPAAGICYTADGEAIVQAAAVHVNATEILARVADSHIPAIVLASSDIASAIKLAGILVGGAIACLALAVFHASCRSFHPYHAIQ